MGILFCTSNSDDNRHENFPNTAGEISAAGPGVGKISSRSGTHHTGIALAGTLIRRSFLLRQDQYITLLEQAQMQISMSRTTNPYDNAHMESFFKTLKYEEVHLANYETYDDVVHRVPHFEEVYNSKRLHSALGYLPAANDR